MDSSSFDLVIAQKSEQREAVFENLFLPPHPLLWLWGFINKGGFPRAPLKYNQNVFFYPDHSRCGAIVIDGINSRHLLSIYYALGTVLSIA